MYVIIINRFFRKLILLSCKPS